MLTRTLACSLALAGLIAASPLAQAQDADARGAHPYYWFQGDHSDMLPFNPEQFGRLMSPVRPGEYYLGLSLRPADETLRSQLRLDEGQGLVVISVMEDSSAAAAGLEKHDVLTQIDGVKITGQQMLVDAIQKAGKNDREVELSYIRAGEPAKLSLKPMKREDFKLGEAAPGPEQPFQLGPEPTQQLKGLRNLLRDQFKGNDDLQSQIDALRDQVDQLKKSLEEADNK